MIIPTDAPYLAEFCEDFAPQSRGFLVPHAAEVILMTRIGSIRLATQYFSKKFNRKFSTKPINDIIAKVRRGEIVVTEEEIAAKAKCVPLAAQFVEKCPWMLNPKSSKSLEQQKPTPAEKQTTIDKKIAKKKAKEKTPEPVSEAKEEATEGTVRKFVPRQRVLVDASGSNNANSQASPEVSSNGKPIITPERQAAIDRFTARNKGSNQQ